MTRPSPNLSALLLLLALLPAALAHAAQSCPRVELTGEVAAGAEWRAPIGEGWVFRVLPVHGHSGWDLVVDRDPAAGYPDALLLATPPYNSMNEREIAPTFGLRAQDALGWNPRTFRFLTNPAAFRQAQQLFLGLEHSGQLAHPSAQQTAQLLQLESHAATGEVRIVDARLTPGTGDAQPFAENWARAFSRSSYTIQAAPAGQPTPTGTLNWMKFTLTLTLPAGWKLPRTLHATPVPCIP